MSGSTSWMSYGAQGVKGIDDDDDDNDHCAFFSAGPILLTENKPNYMYTCIYFFSVPPHALCGLRGHGRS